jgi:hypothetical protein
MKMQTKVLILAAIAALAFLAAWLIPEPTLRPLDLASVKGGEPPPCKYKLLADTCQDWMDFCGSITSESACNAQGQCSGCTGTTPLYSLDSTGYPKTILSGLTSVQVDCGFVRSSPVCSWDAGVCKCVGQALPGFCQTWAWNSYDEDCTWVY